MKLSIIPSDGAVYKNNSSYLDLTWVGTPSDVHALQWQDASGWIEYNDGKPNEIITSLPDWANNAIAAWTAAAEEQSRLSSPTVLSYQQKYLMLTTERDRRLALSDYTQLPDVIALHNSVWLQEWVNYRQELRDLPQLVSQSNIDSVPWPTPPAE